MMMIFLVSRMRTKIFSRTLLTIYSLQLKPQNTETKTTPSTVSSVEAAASSTTPSGKRPAENTEAADDSAVQLFKKKKKRKQA